MLTHTRRTATYRCYHCLSDQAGVKDRGPWRQGWCGRCAARRLFWRARVHLVARAWPPKERAAHA